MKSKLLKIISVKVFIFFSLVLIFTLFLPVKSYAMPAYDGPSEARQPSGKTFETRTHGDEWSNWIETGGRRIYENDKTGNWEYYRYLDFIIISISISNTPFNSVVGEVNSPFLSFTKGPRTVGLAIGSYISFVLVSILGVLLFFFAIASIVLIYRWKKYGTANNRRFFIMMVCLGVFIFLYGGVVYYLFGSSA